MKEAIDARCESGGPATTQQEADDEPIGWGEQWLAGTKYNEPEWPRDIAKGLVEMALENFTKAVLTFPTGTGLGWDGIHPRALLRLDRWLQLWISENLFHCESTGK